MLKLKYKLKEESRHVWLPSRQSPYISCADPEGVGAGFYTKLNVWGSLGLNFDYDGGPIIENGGPIFLYKRRNFGR